MNWNLSSPFQKSPRGLTPVIITPGQLSGKDRVGTIISILPGPSAWESQPLEGRGFRKDSGTNNKIIKESPGVVISHVTESEVRSWNSVKTLPTQVPSELPGLLHWGSISYLMLRDSKKNDKAQIILPFKTHWITSSIKQISPRRRGQGGEPTSQ